MSLSSQSLVVVSIFYAKKNWNILINECLNPFLDEVQRTGYAVNYCLLFDNEQGDHLKLNIVSLNNNYTIKANLNKALTSFLSRIPSEASEKKSIFTGIFMDFENNTFYFNLFKPKSGIGYILNPITVSKVRNELTKLMLNYFSDEIVNSSNTLTFSLNIQFVMARELFQSRKTAYYQIQERFEELISCFELNLQNRINKIASTVLKDNKKQISASIEQLWNSTGEYPNEFTWLQNWGMLCSKLLDKELSGIIIYLDIYRILNEHINYQNQDHNLASLKIAFSILK